MEQTIPIPVDVRDLAERIGANPDHWRHQCHVASLQIVRSWLFPGAQVARGTAPGILGQHSWVVVPPDDLLPYDPERNGPLAYHPEARIVDATMWSYSPETPGIVSASNSRISYRPHGAESIWDAGQPRVGYGEPIWLGQPVGGDPRSPGQRFLDLCGPLDLQGWQDLLSGPMMGWPAREVLRAAYEHPKLRALIPVDHLGMVAGIDPEGLYA